MAETELDTLSLYMDDTEIDAGRPAPSGTFGLV